MTVDVSLLSSPSFSSVFLDPSLLHRTMNSPEYDTPNCTHPDGRSLLLSSSSFPSFSSSVNMPTSLSQCSSPPVLLSSSSSSLLSCRPPSTFSSSFYRTSALTSAPVRSSPVVPTTSSDISQYPSQHLHQFLSLLEEGSSLSSHIQEEGGGKPPGACVLKPSASSSILRENSSSSSSFSRLSMSENNTSLFLSQNVSPYSYSSQSHTTSPHAPSQRQPPLLPTPSLSLPPLLPLSSLSSPPLAYETGNPSLLSTASSAQRPSCCCLLPNAQNALSYRRHPVILSEKKTGRVRDGEAGRGEQGESSGVTLVEKHEKGGSQDLSRRGRGEREGEERIQNGIGSSLHVGASSSSSWKGDEGISSGGGVYTPGGHLTCALQQQDLSSGSLEGGFPPSSSGVYAPQSQQQQHHHHLSPCIPSSSSLIAPPECHNTESSSSSSHLPLPTPPSYTAIIADNPPLLDFPPHPSPLLHFRHEKSHNSTTPHVSHPLPSLPTSQPSDPLLPSPPLPQRYPSSSSSTSSSFFPLFSYHPHPPHHYTLPQLSSPSPSPYYQSPSSHPAAHYPYGYPHTTTTTTTTTTATTPMTSSSPEEKGLLPSPPSYIHSSFHASSPLPLPQHSGVSPHDVWGGENKDDQEIETQRRHRSESQLSSSASSSSSMRPSTAILLHVEKKKKNENERRGDGLSQKTGVSGEGKSREEEEEKGGEKKEEKEQRIPVKKLSNGADNEAEKNGPKKGVAAPQGEKDKEERLSGGVVERESKKERKSEEREKDEEEEQEGTGKREKEKGEKEKMKLGKQRERDEEGKESEEEVPVRLCLTSAISSICAPTLQRKTDTQERSIGDVIPLVPSSSEETRERKEKKEVEKKKERGTSCVSESCHDAKAHGRKEKRVRRLGDEGEREKRFQREEEEKEEEEKEEDCSPSFLTRGSSSGGLEGEEEKEGDVGKGVHSKSSPNERETFFSVHHALSKKKQRQE